MTKTPGSATKVKRRSIFNRTPPNLDTLATSCPNQQEDEWMEGTQEAITPSVKVKARRHSLSPKPRKSILSAKKNLLVARTSTMSPKVVTWGNNRYKSPESLQNLTNTVRRPRHTISGTTAPAAQGVNQTNRNTVPLNEKINCLPPSTASSSNGTPAGTLIRQRSASVLDSSTPNNSDAPKVETMETPLVAARSPILSMRSTPVIAVKSLAAASRLTTSSALTKITIAESSAIVKELSPTGAAQSFGASDVISEQNHTSNEEDVNTDFGRKTRLSESFSFVKEQTSAASPLLGGNLSLITQPSDSFGSLSVSDVDMSLFDSSMVNDRTISATLRSRRSSSGSSMNSSVTCRTFGGASRSPKTPILEKVEEDALAEKVTEEIPRFVSPLKAIDNYEAILGTSSSVANSDVSEDLKPHHSTMPELKESMESPMRRSPRNSMSNGEVTQHDEEISLHGVAVMDVKSGTSNSARQLSPASRQNNSPLNNLEDARGVKRLSTVASPVNVLDNFDGVEHLVQTPKATKQPENSLDDVGGVKQLFASPKEIRSPKNSLSNVMGVKKLLATPTESKTPENNLDRTFSGLRVMMATPKEVRSPRNDLDITFGGVKKLLNTPSQAQSPKNDLDITFGGVKKVLASPIEVKSPMNNLDITFGGVKKLLTTPTEVKSPRNDLDITFGGVKNLVNTPSVVKSPLNSLDRSFRGVKRMLATPNQDEVGPNDSVLESVAQIMSSPLISARKRAAGRRGKKLADLPPIEPGNESAKNVKPRSRNAAKKDTDHEEQSTSVPVRTSRRGRDKRAVTVVAPIEESEQPEESKKSRGGEIKVESTKTKETKDIKAKVGIKRPLESTSAKEATSKRRAVKKADDNMEEPDSRIVTRSMRTRRR